MNSPTPFTLSKLILDQNCTKGGKTKNFNTSIDYITKFINSERGKNLRSLSIAGGPKSQLKSDIFPLLFGLHKNTSISELNVSGHDMGSLGGSSKIFFM